MKEKLTIIIVDDSKIICDRLSALIAEMATATKICCAHNFTDAVQLFEKHKADVAILDINLPDKNGIELLQEIKQKAYPVKIVIMMTEDASEEKKEKCLQFGADHFLNKFSDFEKIPAIIEQLSSRS